MRKIRWLLTATLVCGWACNDGSSDDTDETGGPDSSVTFSWPTSGGGASSTTQASDTSSSTSTSSPVGASSSDVVATDGQGTDASESSSGDTGSGDTGSGDTGSGNDTGTDDTGTSSSGPPDDSTSTGDPTPAESSDSGDSSSGSQGSSESGEEDGSGSPLPPLDPYSDDFEDPELSASRWLLRDVVEGTEPQYTTLDFGVSTPGALTVIPTTSGWFGNYDGPFVYKTFTGNFMVETEVSVTTLNPANPGGPPALPYNSAGLLLRDPNHTEDAENWITHNIGNQNGVISSEGKRTLNSTSRLVLVPGVHRGRLRVCRVDGVVWLTRRLENEAEFQLTHEYGVPPDDPWGLFAHEELQVGMSVTAWNSFGSTPNMSVDPDIRAEWSYIRFWRIGELEACLVND